MGGAGPGFGWFGRARRHSQLPIERRLRPNTDSYGFTGFRVTDFTFITAPWGTVVGTIERV